MSHELIVSYGRGDDISMKLESVYKEVTARFNACSHKFRQFDDESGSVIVDMSSLHAEANQVSQEFEHYFDTYVSLKMRHSFSEGKYRYKSHHCIAVAFSVLGLQLAASEEINDTAIVLDCWKGILTTS